ncbi:MAG: DUF3618 domain-containing protein [Actinomycetota bacterium]|nr:DUF3618 domain-containing protein [Actinomycetota bacterium]
MGQDERESEQAVTDEDRGPEEIRQEIEQTREELGETVNALSEKTDVKGRARDKVSDIKDSISAKADEAKDKAASSGAGSGSFDVEQAQVKARQAVDAAQQNPPALAIGAFLLGLVIGRALGRRSASE